MTPTEFVQDLFAAFGRGDVEYIVGRVAADCVWVAPGEGIPSAGTYHGKAGALEFFRKQSQSEEILGFEPKEFFANGNSVVALGFEQCRAVSTGQTASTHWAMLFRVRDGELIRFEGFYDTLAYAHAHAAVRH